MPEGKQHPKPVPEGKQNPGPLEWVSEAQIISHRDWALGFLLSAYGLLLVSTLVIIFFQGFTFRGFHLEPAFLNWLGGATITQVALIAAAVYRSLFKLPKENP